ncbi:hypothetical protein JCM10449v2_005812 [Rhodotorula kratochvilovae]
MTATTSRLGRKINRPCGQPRTPACVSCAQRRVRCDGGSPCQACLRLAAWRGHPPPLECIYEGGRVPARKNAYGNAEASTSAPSTSRSTSAPASAPKKGRRCGGPALQKGLACLACKSRRVRCDGAKPACGACVSRKKRAPHGAEHPPCVYRADLYLAQQEQGQRPEEESPRVEMDAEIEDEGAEADLSDYGIEVGDASDAIPFDISTSLPTSPMSLLPALLPPLPPLPHASAIAQPPPLMFAPYPLFPHEQPGYFNALPPRSSSFSSSLSSSSAYPPSPALDSLSPSDLDELLSSCSSWPSPRTPLDPWTTQSLLRLTNYPPVPYPPPSSDEAGAGINPLWTEAVPPLELGALALCGWDLPPSSIAGAAAADKEREREATPVPGGGVADLMFTLPMEAAFAGEWNGAAAAQAGAGAGMGAGARA